MCLAHGRRPLMGGGCARRVRLASFLGVEIQPISAARLDPMPSRFVQDARRSCRRSPRGGRASSLPERRIHRAQRESRERQFQIRVFPVLSTLARPRSNLLALRIARRYKSLLATPEYFETPEIGSAAPHERPRRLHRRGTWRQSLQLRAVHRHRHRWSRPGARKVLPTRVFSSQAASASW